MDDIVSLGFLATTLGATWRLATPLIFASIGEVFSERAGVLNIGLEGVMIVGAFAGFAAVVSTGSLPLGFAAAMLAGMAVGLVFALFTITIKADQIVVGAALNLLGLGLTAFLFRTYFVSTGRGVEVARPIDIPGLSDLPFFGEALFRQNLVVYSTLLLVLVAVLVLYRTSFGLTLRAVGEHPKTVDVAGRSVAAYRYGAVLMTNGDGGAKLYGEVLHALARQYGWPGFDPEVKSPIRMSADALGVFAGRYQVPDIGVLTLRAGDDALIATSTFFAGETTLLPEGPTRFFDKGNRQGFEFELDQGKVIAVSIAGRIRALREVQ